MVRWSLLSLIAAAVFASLAGAGPALAQRSPRTVVAVNPEFRNYGERLGPGYLDVYADGELCGRMSFTDFASRTTDGGAELELGRPGQAVACGTEGAEISFRRGDRTPLVQTLALKRSARLMLTSFNVALNWAPDPVPTANGRTVVAVTVDLRKVGEQHSGGFVDVYANGRICGRLSFTDPAARTADGGAEFEIGRPGQPAACSTEGAAISFKDGNGDSLILTYTLKRGARHLIINLATPPPTTVSRTVVAVTAEFRGYGQRAGDGFLDVYANGEPCGRLSFIDPAAVTADGGTELELGLPGQPAGCGTEGAEIVFRHSNSSPLIQTLTLKRGARLMLTRLGTVPGWAPDPLPTGDGRTVVAVTAGSGATANGGLRSTSTSTPMASSAGDCRFPTLPRAPRTAGRRSNSAVPASPRRATLKGRRSLSRTAWAMR